MARFGATFSQSLTFENISYQYEQSSVLDNLSLHVESGEVVCILGESGCGKSTLLKIAAGLIRQDKGELWLGSNVIANDHHFVLPENRGVGLVFQDYALFPHMNVLQNVMFGLRKVSKVEAIKQAEVALSTVGLENFADVYPNALSGGQQQRVALARALVPRPSVLLLDEPFSNLDRMMRNKVREETMRILKSIGATSIVVTHDAEEAMRIGDRIALIHKGKIEQIGTSKEVYQSPNNLRVARFLGTLNEVEGIAEAATIITPIGTFPNLHNHSGKVIVALRPENINICAPNEHNIRAQITRQLFLGSIDLLEIAIHGIEQKLLAFERPGLSLSEGMEISIRIAPNEILVFDANLI